jgi:hypothetical protein
MAKKLAQPKPLDFQFPFSDPTNMVNFIIPFTKQLLDTNKYGVDNEIICRRFGIGFRRAYTLEEIGGYLTITRERVRQREYRAIKLIRGNLTGIETDLIVPVSVIEEYKRLRSDLMAMGEVIIEPQVMNYFQVRYGLILNKEENRVIRFLMELMVFREFGENPISHLKTVFFRSWATNDRVDIKAFILAQKSLYRVFLSVDDPQDLFDIMSSLNKGRKSKIPQTIVSLAIPTYKELEVIDNKYQIRFDDLGSLADKAYRILKEKGNPLKVQDIQMEINHRLAVSQSGSRVGAASIGNQLSVDKRFFPLGGGGLWALKEWDEWTSKTIISLMKEYLDQKRAGASPSEIFEYVKQKRPDVLRKSIDTSLGQKDKFTRISRNTYVPVEWKWKGIKTVTANRNKRSSPLRDSIRSAVISSLAKKPDNKMEMAMLRDKVMKELKCKRGTFYRYLGEMDNILKEMHGQVMYCQLVTPQASTQPGIQTIGDWSLLIQKGESSTVELKLAAKWNEYEKKPDGNMIQGIIQEIAGFMNADGGHIFIGVDDKTKEIKGIENDYLVINKQKPNKDGYELFLRDTINQKLGSDLSSFYEINFRNIKSKEVCCITVGPALRVVYYDKDLYLRAGNQANKLSAAEAVDFVKRREDELKRK